MTKQSKKKKKLTPYVQREDNKKHQQLSTKHMYTPEIQHSILLKYLLDVLRDKSKISRDDKRR